MSKSVLLSLIGLLCLGSIILAEVPKVINYQGRLVDDNGQPVADGYYGLTFTLYDHPTETAGHELWTSGERSVAVTNGLFTYQLGTGKPFPSNMVSDTLLWLGIRLYGETEMSPRTKLTSVPFAYHSNTADELTEGNENWLDESGDTLEGAFYFDMDGQAGHLDISGGAADLWLGDNGYVTAQLLGDNYGALYLKNNLGGNRVIAYAGLSAGGHFSLLNPIGFTTVRLDANDNVGGSLRLSTETDFTSAYIFTTDDCGAITLYGIPGSNMYFNGSLEGDETAILPDDAVNSDEMLNEPGIVAESNATIHNVTSTTMQDIETVTITIPSDGYIVVTGKAWGAHSGTTEDAKTIVQIDETAGGAYVYPYYTVFGCDQYLSTGTYLESIFIQRVYYKEQGTYTFRMEAARNFTSTNAEHVVGDPILIVTYYPTSYGSVNTMVSSSEATGFDNIEYLPSSRNFDGKTQYTETNVKVNLRELEMKAKQLRDEIKQREIELKETERMMEEEQRRNEPRSDD